MRQQRIRRVRWVQVIMALALATGCDEGSGIDAPGAGGSGLHGTSALPAGAGSGAPVAPGWQEDALTRIAAGEYRFRATGDEGYEASNRSQGLVARLDPQGVRVGPRRGGGGDEGLTLSLRGWGRGGSLRAAPGAVPAEGACDATGRRDEQDRCLTRVEYARGDAVEWWENRREGIEQGFTLASLPRGAGPLVLEVAIRGAEVEVDASGTSAVIAGPSGTHLRYGGLRAWDGRGMDLPVTMAGVAGGVRLVVDDSGAVAPVTVDPLLTAEAWTAESDQAGAGFGGSVASAGDVNGDGYGDVVVGARSYEGGQTDEGRAFLYLGSAGGLQASPSWAAECDQAGAGFGGSVSAAGDVNGDGYGDVVVGAPAYDNGQSEEGRAYLYLGSASGLQASPAWTAESDQVDASFGTSVSSAGDVNGDGYADVVVGAHWYGNGEAYEGRAYLYLGSASGLQASPSWTAEPDQAGALFGASVSSAGDVNGDGYGDVVVGAYWYDNGQTDEGRAYLYLGSAGGLSPSPSWTAEPDQNSAYFGSSVSGAGDVDGDGYGDVVVGAYSYDSGETNEGRAYLYLGSAGGLQASPSWTAESDQSHAYFGGAVGMAGDLNGDGYGDVVVGAFGFNDGETDEGRAYVYFGSASGLATSPSWTAESDQASARFGASVSPAGDVNGDGYGDVLVGAYTYDNGETDEGRATLFQGSASGLATASSWTGESDQVGAGFGYSVSSAGDVNGDGYGDVVVGAFDYDDGETDEGAAFLFLGSASGLSASASWTARSDQAEASFGQSVSSAGDVNGDGYGDVVVGAPYYDDGETNEGAAFLYLGSSSGLSPSASWTAGSHQASAYFGFSVSSAGDVDGDGYGDVVVGAHYYEDGETDEGGAFLYLGSAGGLQSSPSWTAESDQAGAAFGASVSSAGDVNGDGYGDVVVGARAYDDGQAEEGGAFLYLGSASGLQASPSWTGESDQVDAAFGSSVSSAGDVNGDGYGDVVVGARYFTNGELYEGRAYLYPGSPSGLSPSASWTSESDEAGADFGSWVSSAGDVNGDGYGDVVVGAFRHSGGETNEGAAFLYLGSSSGLSGSASWTSEPNQANASFGRSVSSAGDVNGDGYGDLVVGAYAHDNGQTDEGGAFVYLGNGADGTGPGLALAAQARQPGATAPVAPGLTSDAEDGFDVAMALARTARGRSRVKLEVEVRALGQPFDGTDTIRGESWVDSGLGGTALQQALSGLTAGTGHHWRARVLVDPASGGGQLWGPWEYGGPSGAAHHGHVYTAGGPWYADADADGFGDPGAPRTTRDGPQGGDTLDATDCDDLDATAFPGAAEACDGVDDDCDGEVDDGLTFDADADGHTSLASCEGSGDDCDDADATAFPGAAEACDGVDDDCDGEVDEDLSMDADGDGHSPFESCGGTRDDCDDADPAVHPGVAEICDGVDDDCDGVVPYSERDQDGDGFTPCGGDCHDQDAATWPGAAERCNGLDDDCDGEADEGLTADADADGYTSAASCAGTRDDCDDADPAVNPAAAETCDGVDQDCDGGADDGLTIDADGDGHSTADSCGGTRDDCDDGRATAYAGAVEVCDGLDDDCDGAADDGLTFDADADGRTSAASCEGTRDDCDDADPAVNPAAAETCDGVDQDCDGDVDDGLTIDADGDGHSTADSCAGTRDDCDDSIAAVYAGAVETCDGLDDDCDGAVDDGLTTDADADGHTSAASCEGTRDDCDDADPAVNPAAAETCDGVDEDCDGSADDGLTVDADGDGYSTPASCGGTRDDCDDAVAYTHPGIWEYCDGADNDCDGFVPRGERDGDGDGQRRCEADCNDQDAATYDGAPEACDGIDNDCDEVIPADEADADGDGYALCSGECDDAEPLVNPGLAEVCGDGLDNDCNGTADDGCPVAPVPGSLVISEVMINPTAAVDNRGEWFEVLNLSADTLDLEGVTVASNGGSRTLNGTVLLAPGAYAVLGRNGNLGQNGGVTMDALYGSAVLLDNGTDTLTLTAPGGALLDAFAWGVGDAPTGASLTLSDAALDPDLNDDVGLWCLAASTFGAGDLGTPGAPNDHCPMVVTPVAGDLVITEVLADPLAVVDARGEWFEVANVSADILDLDGVTVTTSAGSATITGGVQVPVGGYALLGRYGNPNQNGGVTPDYVYGNGPTLSEAGDTLTLGAPDASLLDAFTWGAGVFGAGAALSLDPSQTDDLANDDVGAWCDAVDPFGAGDLGTPGAANPACVP